MSEAEKMAARLTGAQRKWLPLFSHEKDGWLPIGMSKKTREALLSYGLIEKHVPQGWGFIEWSLSSLGAEVVAVLQEQSK